MPAMLDRSDPRADGGASGRPSAVARGAVDRADPDHRLVLLLVLGALAVAMSRRGGC